MSDANKQVVKDFVDAFARGDLVSALSHLAEDALVDEADGMPHSGKFIGPSGFQKLLDKMLANLDASVQSNDLDDAGEFIVSRLSMTFTSKATKREFPTTVCELYWVLDGKIVKLDSFYKDPAAVNELYHETR